MVPYGTIWYHTVPCGSIWYHMVPYGTIWYRMVPYGLREFFVETRVILTPGAATEGATAAGKSQNGKRTGQNPPEPARTGQNRSEPARTSQNWPELGVSCQKSYSQSRGIAKVKNVLPMLREKHFCLLLLMQHGNHILAFLIPLCGNLAQTKSGLPTREGLQKSKLCFPCSMRSTFFCASHAAWEAHFCN